MTNLTSLNKYYRIDAQINNCSLKLKTMPRKSERERANKKAHSDKNRRNPTMVVLLLEKSDINISDYASAGSFHKTVGKKIGAIGLLAFSLPLNGLSNQFTRLSKEADYLLIHKESKSMLDKEEREMLLNKINEIKQMHKSLKIFATPQAVTALNLNGSTLFIQRPTEIINFIKEA